MNIGNYFEIGKCLKIFSFIFIHEFLYQVIKYTVLMCKVSRVVVLNLPDATTL